MSNNIHVTFRRVDSSQALKDYVTEKLGRVLKLHDRACDAHVTLSVEKFRHIAEVFLGDKQVTIKAFESTTDLYSAIDLVCDKVERQLGKFRERRKDKVGEALREPMVSGSSLTVRDEKGLRIVAQEGNFLPKPMSVEDAAQHLDLLKADVLMFVNQDTNQPSVVFRQQDGNVGFTEPVGR
jgi:putative sigma-54 modulation protein